MPYVIAVDEVFVMTGKELKMNSPYCLGALESKHFETVSTFAEWITILLTGKAVLLY
jgi:hypothetical protein